MVILSTTGCGAPGGANGPSQVREGAPSSSMAAKAGTSGNCGVWIVGERQRGMAAAPPFAAVRNYCSRAFTSPLALAMSICPAYLPRSTPMTLPMSFMAVAPVSATAASIAAFISSSDICFGR